MNPEVQVQITPSPATSARACERCVHFRSSMKEAPGRGLCVLYSLIMSRDDSCRSGYRPIQQSAGFKPELQGIRA